MKAKANPVLILAMVLLCLVMITTHMTAGLYARYTSSGSGEDSARVAKFEVTQSGTLTENMALSVKPGDESDQKPGQEAGNIEVTNNSEVAVAYTIHIKIATNNLKDLKLFVPSQENTPTRDMTFTGNISPNSTRTFEIRSWWPLTQDSLDYRGMVDKLEITLKAEQID